jgi:hypothetical protein
MNITNVPSATASVALGLNGSGGVVSFAVPTTSGLVPYTGATATVNLNSQSIYAGTARFTAITSAAPNLALGIDVSGNLNTFTVPTATNLLPLNNTWTGSNTYNAGIQIAAGSLGVATGNIVKQSATALSFTQITGGSATNSPYMEYYFSGNRRGYIGNANATDMYLVAENGAQLSFGVAGAQRMSIATSGNTTMTTPLLDVNNTLTTASNNITFTLRNSAANPSNFAFVQKTTGSGAYHSLTQAGDTIFMSMDQQNGVSGANGIVIACWNQTAGLRIGPSASAFSGPLTVGGNVDITAGDSSYIRYGPNSTWNSYLVVGATPDRAGVGTAQVITTDGNLHLDAGNSKSMYYGFYANSRGTPNSHLFYGSNIQLASNLPQNSDYYSQVVVLNGTTLQKSQCVMREIYFSNNVAWSGGINITYAFYHYNTISPVQIYGKCSGYYTGGGMMQTTIRLYSQSNGTYYYYPLNSYVNVGNNHFTVPLNVISNGLPTGWFDVYVYSSSGWITDGNDQLTVCVQILPVRDF